MCGLDVHHRLLLRLWKLLSICPKLFHRVCHENFNLRCSLENIREYNVPLRKLIVGLGGILLAMNAQLLH